MFDFYHIQNWFRVGLRALRIFLLNSTNYEMNYIHTECRSFWQLKSKIMAPKFVTKVSRKADISFQWKNTVIYERLDTTLNAKKFNIFDAFSCNHPSSKKKLLSMVLIR